MSAPPVVSGELKALLRKLKLGRSLDTLPERLALAKTRSLSHAEFLELVLADEVTRRDTSSAAQRARAAGLDSSMRLEHWDSSAAVTYDHAMWDELCSLRFVEAAHNVVIMGPVGVGKTFMATALGHAAVRRRYSVHFERTDRLLKRLKASRLDNSHDAEVRKLLRVDVLVLDLSRPRDYPDRDWAPGGKSLSWWASASRASVADRHNHRLSRNASSVSGGRKRPGFEEGCVVRASARSLMVMSACK